MQRVALPLQLENTLPSPEELDSFVQKGLTTFNVPGIAIGIVLDDQLEK